MYSNKNHMFRLDLNWTIWAMSVCGVKLSEFKSLNCSDKNLEELPLNLGLFRNLKMLECCDNNLTEISDIVLQLQNLEQLFFNRNKIQTLTENFGDLQNLTLVCGDHNELKYLNHLPSDEARQSEANKFAY